MPISTDFEKAKDGRWVLLVGGRPDHWYDGDEPVPPAVVARWHVEEYANGLGNDNRWMFCYYDGASYGYWHDPIGFIELSDFGVAQPS